MARLRDNFILTTQDNMTLHLTDTNALTFTRLARLALNPSHAAIAAGFDNDAYIASNVSTPEQPMGVIVTHLKLPT